MWELYDALVEGIPSGIRVEDFACGVSWSYVRTAESMGIAATVKLFDRPPMHRGPVIGADLRDIAALMKEAKENGVELITEEHMKIINDKRAKEKKEKDKK